MEIVGNEDERTVPIILVSTKRVDTSYRRIPASGSAEVTIPGGVLEE